MAIIREKIAFQSGQGAVETDKVIFELGQGTETCERVSFISITYWDRPATVITPKRPVKFIKIRLRVEDITGVIYITDLKFQGGQMPILWSGHISEIKFSFEQ